ncbi:MAG TPA: diaminopimelate epimerase [Burkholderiales bacterium]|nr:diaminopimelate epimerase [Burkholderiales bacterium]HYA46169.1 diaminopimelate epimerase [Burkholderiales bacterium]
MKLSFTKMQGAGNDFVVLDGVSRPVDMTPQRARKIADRHFGVGCDQVLLVERPRGDADFRYRIWNSDGGEVEQCGNGARCFVRFVHDKGLTRKREIRVETLSGIIAPRLEADGEVSVDMGAPRFAPQQVPFDASGLEPVGARWPIEVAGKTIRVAVLSMGNPHAVQTVEDVDAAPVTTQGPLIERHPRFPRRTNAGYMQILDRSSVRLRVWERGAGETLACGTGACAAVVTGIREGLLEDRVQVETRGGRLTVRWDGGENERDRSVWMTGPAVTVFEGEIEIES